MTAIPERKWFGGYSFEVAKILGKPKIREEKYKALSDAASYRTLGWQARVAKVSGGYTVYVRPKR